MSAVNVAILDYGLGNIRSIRNALVSQGGAPVMTRNENEILRASGLILPGVGAFSHGMDQLKEYGLVEVIRKYVNSGKPVMGICLGMQLFMEFSEEHGWREGLGLMQGGVHELPLERSEVVRLPHVGWNRIHSASGDAWETGTLKSLPSGQFFYFIHSYAVRPGRESDIYAWTEYGKTRFASAVRRDNVSGFQFHPEKSGEAGLSIWRNFLIECKGPLI
ncbi:hypothetical protein UR09_06580 [Candidatus Nitromaritima sp. SCGC AAA799-A02]|nr:hypothetical protein UR09_06580 [Candidatus Nitromaritima sp. SCGC AAA799-A02]